MYTVKEMNKEIFKHLPQSYIKSMHIGRTRSARWGFVWHYQNEINTELVERIEKLESEIARLKKQK